MGGKARDKEQVEVEVISIEPEVLKEEKVLSSVEAGVICS